MMKIATTMILLSCVIPGYVQGQKQVVLNPINNGYFADPSIVKYQDTYYIYATIDPWGGNELAVLATKDFRKWEQKHINWPTKEACTSSSSMESMVWAPSVVKATNGLYYMYVSVGSEVWAGISSNPQGPWENAKSDNTPLIRSDFLPGFHMIDAECFIDDDGQAFLYWGSGLNWVNGHCFAVKLKDDMVSFDGTPKDISPPDYFEAPFMYKRNGTYYLMYSNGKAIDHTYNIRYSTAKTPFGPWVGGVNNPILSTSSDSTTFGPGHHTVFSENGQSYILYHRILPQKKEFVLRQLCVDSLNFNSSGNIMKVKPKGIVWHKK